MATYFVEDLNLRSERQKYLLIVVSEHFSVGYSLVAYRQDDEICSFSSPAVWLRFAAVAKFVGAATALAVAAAA